MSDTPGPLIGQGINRRPVCAIGISMNYWMKHSLSHLSWTTFSETVFVKISTINGLNVFNMLFLQEFLVESLIFCAEVRPNIPELVNRRNLIVKNVIISGVGAWKRAFWWDMIISRDPGAATDQCGLAHNQAVWNKTKKFWKSWIGLGPRKIWKSRTKSGRSGIPYCKPRCNRINILAIRISRRERWL